LRNKNPRIAGDTEAITVKRKTTEKKEHRENIGVAGEANFKIKSPRFIEPPASPTIRLQRSN
jgi:hypothetical protein